MFTVKQQYVFERAKFIINNADDGIPALGDMVANFCVKNGICTRCHCRHTEPKKKNCERCLAYKRIHKLNAKASSTNKKSRT